MAFPSNVMEAVFARMKTTRIIGKRVSLKRGCSVVAWQRQWRMQDSRKFGTCFKQVKVSGVGLTED